MKNTSEILKQITEQQMSVGDAITVLQLIADVVKHDIGAAETYCATYVTEQRDHEIELGKIKFSIAAITLSLEFCSKKLELTAKLPDSQIRTVYQEILLDTCAAQAENIQELVGELRGVCEELIKEGEFSFYGLAGIIEH